jgi:hypothetical protein
MIRDRKKVYGEPNDPNTVLASGTLTANRLIIGDGNKGVKVYSPGSNCILITDENGVVSSLSFNGLANKAIATDGSGNIVLIDRSTLT